MPSATSAAAVVAASCVEASAKGFSCAATSPALAVSARTAVVLVAVIVFSSSGAVVYVITGVGGGVAGGGVAGGGVDPDGTGMSRVPETSVSRGAGGGVAGGGVAGGGVEVPDGMSRVPDTTVLCVCPGVGGGVDGGLGLAPPRSCAFTAIAWARMTTARKRVAMLV